MYALPRFALAVMAAPNKSEIRFAAENTAIVVRFGASFRFSAHARWTLEAVDNRRTIIDEV
jgi:hypothetical protein